MMEVDYDVYAEGEAELGWLNCQVKADAEVRFDLDQLVFELVKRLGQRLTDAGDEVAHLKVLGQTMDDSAVANLVGSTVDAELSLASEIKTDRAELLVNARVAADPAAMETLIGEVSAELAKEIGVQLTVAQMQSFRPAKPEPTHRSR